MSKRVYLARSPDQNKVTTIDVRLGIHGIPYGWEYFVMDKADLPAGKLKTRWDELAADKRILLSTTNKDKLTVKEVLKNNTKLALRAQSLQDHRQRMLTALDIEFIRSMELPVREKTNRQEAIGKFKNDLRDLKIEAREFISEEEFLEWWPPVFDTTISDYKDLPNKSNMVLTGIVLILLFVLAPFLTFIISSS